MDTCSICLTHVKKNIKCLNCNNIYCKQCIEHILINKNSHCINCNINWNEDFISQILTKSKYKEYLKLNILEHHKALLPCTQLILSEQNKINLNCNILLQNNKQIVYKCQVENCRGYITFDWKCGLCHTIICNQCYSIITDENHICKIKNIILNKNCPQCNIIIYKLDMCTFTYCLNCKTEFNWENNQVITKKNNNDKIKIHIPTPYVIYNILIAKYDCNDETIKQKINTIMNILRYIKYFKNKFDKINITDDNLSARIDYLINKNTEEQLKNKLYKKEKEFNKNVEILAIVNFLDLEGKDICDNILKNTLDDVLNQFNDLKYKVNNTLKKISDKYNSTYYHISDNWIIV